MLLNKSVKNLDFGKPYVWLATWLGSGMIDKAPGTWGSLASIPFAVVIYKYSALPGLAVAAIGVYVLGLWAAGLFEKATGQEDNKMIVIDEVVGQWIALAPALYLAGFNILYITLAFAAFRAFDIMKPWPVSVAEKKLKGAHAVMMDDVIAGALAAVCVTGVYYA